jgi:hypothetical protein
MPVSSDAHKKTPLAAAGLLVGQYLTDLNQDPVNSVVFPTVVVPTDMVPSTAAVTVTVEVVEGTAPSVNVNGTLTVPPVTTPAVPYVARQGVTVKE